MAAWTRITNVFQARRTMRSLKIPVRKPARFKIRVRHLVRAAIDDHAKAIDEAFAGVEQVHLQRIVLAVGTGRIVEHPVRAHNGPRALGSLVAVGPVRWQTIVAMWIDQLETAATAVAPVRSEERRVGKECRSRWA